MSASTSKYANQARRLPGEIEQLKRAGRDEEAQRAAEHLRRAQDALQRRGGR